MKIALIAVMYNEHDLLPWFIKHYQETGVDEFHLFDHNSPDPRGKEICSKHKNIIVHDFRTPNDLIDDDILIRLKNQFYKELLGFDWFMVVDLDEFLYHPKMRELLNGYSERGITLPKVQGFWMAHESFPEMNGKQMYEVVVKGLPNSNLNKRAVFKACVDINYMHGAHNCRPSGRVKESPEADIKLLHMSWLGFDWAMKRSMAHAPRLSHNNIQHRWGHVPDLYDTPEKLANCRKQYDIFIREGKPVL